MYVCIYISEVPDIVDCKASLTLVHVCCPAKLSCDPLILPSALLMITCRKCEQVYVNPLIKKLNQIFRQGTFRFYKHNSYIYLALSVDHNICQYNGFSPRGWKQPKRVGTQNL